MFGQIQKAAEIHSRQFQSDCYDRKVEDNIGTIPECSENDHKSSKIKETDMKQFWPHIAGALSGAAIVLLFTPYYSFGIIMALFVLAVEYADYLDKD